MSPRHERRYIRLTAPFFSTTPKKVLLSTTPKKAMAELFVENEWREDGGSRRVGNLFSIHLVGALALSTRSVLFKAVAPLIPEVTRAK